MHCKKKQAFPKLAGQKIHAFSQGLGNPSRTFWEGMEDEHHKCRPVGPHVCLPNPQRRFIGYVSSRILYFPPNNKKFPLSKNLPQPQHLKFFVTQ